MINTNDSLEISYLKMLKGTRLLNEAPGNIFPSEYDEELVRLMIASAKSAMFSTLTCLFEKIEANPDITVEELTINICDMLEDLLPEEE